VEAVAARDERAADPDVKHIIVGTAGHIDHGKTALVRALTGTDTDRLAEEKRRGITIDIGFAHLRLDDELQLGFVDVPGHERFVRNMLAGAAGIDLVLMVIAADELVMPQTREHFDVCRLLGVRHGLVALTKADLVDSDTLELGQLELADFLAGSFLAGGPVIPVSAKTGQGLDALRSALGEVARAAPSRRNQGHFRLPIDRVFVQQGFGTVVTGTTVSGSIDVNSEVEIHPAGRRVRVRGVQSHNQSVEQGGAGRRTALNLAGIETKDLRRGMVAGTPGLFRAATKLDAIVELLPTSGGLKHGAPVHFHTGTAETVARVSLLGNRKKIAGGQSGFARLRLEKPVLGLFGDRFILRRFSPVTTIGGGVLLDGEPARERDPDAHLAHLAELASFDPARVLRAFLKRARYGLGSADVIRCTAWADTEVKRVSRGLRAADEALVLDSELLIEREAYSRATRQVLDFLKQFHEKDPLQPGASKGALTATCFPDAPPDFVDALLGSLQQGNQITVEGEFVRLAGYSVVLGDEEAETREAMIAAFKEAGLSPPAVKDVLPQLPIDQPRARRILQALLRERVLVKVSEDLLIYRGAVDGLKRLLHEERSLTSTIGVARFKELTGISRKYAIPLLEFLDRERVTRREGNERVIL
jgi:selenocysteine-specific elongation factor